MSDQEPLTHTKQRYVGIHNDNGQRIALSTIFNTARGVRKIHQQLTEGYIAQEDALVELVQACLNLVSAVAKPPQEE